jgi:hypothetical protein
MRKQATMACLALLAAIGLAAGGTTAALAQDGVSPPAPPVAYPPSVPSTSPFSSSAQNPRIADIAQMVSNTARNVAIRDYVATETGGMMSGTSFGAFVRNATGQAVEAAADAAPGGGASLDNATRVGTQFYRAGLDVAARAGLTPDGMADVAAAGASGLMSSLLYAAGPTSLQAVTTAQAASAAIVEAAVQSAQNAGLNGDALEQQVSAATQGAGRGAMDATATASPGQVTAVINSIATGAASGAITSGVSPLVAQNSALSAPVGYGVSAFSAGPRFRRTTASVLSDPISENRSDSVASPTGF